MIFFTEKPEVLKGVKSLPEKIEQLKNIGKNFNEESLFQLMKVVFNRNKIDANNPMKTSNIDRIYDLISNAREDIELDIPSGFLDHFENILDDLANDKELKKSIMPSLDMIGVNNRNLKTFEVDLETSKGLAAKIPDNFVKVSESGISNVDLIKDLKNLSILPLY